TGSPAINAGDAATCLVTDQRGVTRSSPCDIGAFELQGSIITPLAGTGGSITPDTPQIVATGDDVTFTIAADTGYHVVDVGVDGVSQGALASYTFSNVTADHTITATFALDTYIITPTAGTGGSISPATAQTVNHGDDLAFTIAADTGYHVVDVGVDGVSQGALASYTFSNVTADHTITATFALLPPGAPTLLAPLRHTVTDTTELTLTWAPVDGATGYTVDLGGVIMDVGDTVISPTGVLATGAYTWTVAAYNAGGIGAYADTWAFAITGAPVNVTLTELTAGTVITFGNEICGSITFTNVGTLPTSLTITYTYNFPSVDHKGLLGQYRISAGGDAGYQAALTLCYADADLRVADIDPAQEPNLHAYRYIAVGQPWQQYSEVDTVANTITAHNVTTFGVFGVGITENQPTAITLGAFTARGGHWFSGLLLVVVLYGLRRKQPLVSQASPRKELQMEVQADVYTAPEIVYEGNLEIQAGSPLSIPSDFEDFEDLDW
ncbi:MAG: choice-of-anchor Q domain-containing protein, partial [Anaerolineales bacterium]